MTLNIHMSISERTVARRSSFLFARHHWNFHKRHLDWLMSSRFCLEVSRSCESFPLKQEDFQPFACLSQTVLLKGQRKN